MDFYNKIKNELINNEINKKVKDYSKNKGELESYYRVGKLLSEAGKHYGENVIKSFSDKLVKELGKKYNERTLRSYRQFYITFKDRIWSPVETNLSWSHYKVLLPIKDENERNYYIKESINNKLSKRDLEKRIKSKEYERLPATTKAKSIKEEKLEMVELIPNPILIPKNNVNINKIKEKVLNKLIVENLDNFLKQLGNGYTYVGSEYQIKLNDRYYYIDLLLFNINFNCYVVIEIKITELKKEDVGQIKFYMNYIDKNIKTINHDKTIGIILCKKGNDLILEYTSDERVYSREYQLL